LDRRVETDLTPEQHLLVCKGDIAYNMMRMWQGVFGFARHEGIVSPAYVVLTPKPKIDSHYASYLFRHRSTIRKFERFSQGLTGDRLRLYFDQFCQIPVEIPDRKFQKKIAEILQAVDDRLIIEEKKLAVMSSLKTALSQGLLTGRIRVDRKEYP
jgi:type I restriction enzyme S subunit